MSLLKIFKKKEKEKKTSDEPKIMSNELKMSGERISAVDSLSLRVLKKPFLSEKTHRLNSMNQYAFIVNLKANKNSVKEAVEKRFNVNVLKVNMIRFHGKPKRFRNKETKQSDFKKAIVTLKKGEKIETI